MFVSPEKKVSFTPFPNIGKRFEALKYWAGVMKIISILNNKLSYKSFFKGRIIGTIISFIIYFIIKKF